MSDVIVLDLVTHVLVDKWYTNRKLNSHDEAKRIIVTAARILKQYINCHEIDKSKYSTADQIENDDCNSIPDILMLFEKELISDNLQQRTLITSNFCFM